MFKSIFFAVTFVSTTATAALFQCRPLHDENAEIWRGIIGSTTKNVTAACEAAEAMNLNPAVSKCIGCLDLSLFDGLNILSNRHCKSAARQVMPGFNPPFGTDTTLAPRYQAIKDKIDAINEKYGDNTILLVEAFQKYLYKELSPDMYADITALIRNKISPCLFKAVVPALFRHMIDNYSRCCDDMKHLFTQMTNQELTTSYTRTMVNKVLDILFTVNGYKQSCVYVIVQAVLNSAMETSLKHALAMPQSQICPAANGDSFQSHVDGGSDYQFPKAIGCCAYPLDSLVSAVKTYPKLQQIIPATVFAQNDYDCADALSIPMVVELLNGITDPELKAKAEAFFTGVCLHVANGYDACSSENNCQTVSSIFNW